MTKICGVISATDQPALVAEQLQLMVQALKHDLHVQEEYIYFDHGGIAVVKAGLCEAVQTIRDVQGNYCLGLCGQLDDVDWERYPIEHGRQAVVAQNDVEFVLRAIQQRGTTALQDLTGSFVCAYYDRTTHSLSIVNDRYGLVPLYFYSNQQICIFASEVKAILQLIGPQELDWESCADFFYIGHMMGQKTLFRQIQALGPGQELIWRDGTVTQRTYDDFTQTNVLQPDIVSTETIAALFTAAVQNRVRSDVPNTLLLSGGFDSRLILGALHTLGVAPNIVSLEHANEAQGADGLFAGRMAQLLGLPCDYRQTRTDFFASSQWLEAFYILDGMLPTFQLFISEVYPELNPAQGMVWDGLALDVALGGSHQGAGGIQGNIKEFIAKRRIHRLLLRLVLTHRQFQTLDRTFMSRVQHELAQIPVSENQFSFFLLKNRTRRRIAVNPYQLYASKVEPLTPGADQHFLDYVLRVPHRLKHNHKLYIDVLRRHFPILTQVPIVSGGTVFSTQTLQSTSASDQLHPGLKKRAKYTRKVRRIVGTIVRLFARSGKEVESQQAAALVIRILEQRYFDRPIYNTRILRRLFALYRNGNMRFHKLFVVAFYIELWHLLFIDKDSSVLFNPKNVDLTAREYT